jgi:hypothetical protein
MINTNTTVNANGELTADAQNVPEQKKTSAQHKASRILRNMTIHAGNYRLQVVALRAGDKVKVNPIELDGISETVPNNPANALLHFGEYAVSALAGKTAEEIENDENLTFLSCVASYGGSVGLKNAITAETSAEKSTKRAKVVRTFADAFADVTAALFAK